MESMESTGHDGHGCRSTLNDQILGSEAGEDGQQRRSPRMGSQGSQGDWGMVELPVWDTSSCGASVKEIATSWFISPITMVYDTY